MRPARSVRRGDLADLARNQPQSATVESAAKRNRDRCVTIPAKFKHSRFLTGERKGSAKSSRVAAGMDDEITVALRRFGCREIEHQASVLVRRGSH